VDATMNYRQIAQAGMLIGFCIAMLGLLILVYAHIEW
jgi:hypothetical protein